MSKRGKRSKEALSRRKINRELKFYILEHSFNDTKLGETICLETHESITDFGKLTFGEDFDRHEESMIYPFYCDCDDGTVLTDSYGRGVFQRV